MAYTDIAAVKACLDIKDASDDELLTALIARAQKAIESATRKIFEAENDTIRNFDPTDDVLVRGRELIFPRGKWLAAITTVKTNADSATPTLLTARADYLTIPLSAADLPYYGLKLTLSGGKRWEYDSDPELGIEIVGRWASAVRAPADIVDATIQLTAWMYKHRGQLWRGRLAGDGQRHY